MDDAYIANDTAHHAESANAQLAARRRRQHPCTE